MTKRLNARTCAQSHIFQHTMRANPHAITQRHRTLKDAANVDKYVLTTGQRTTQIKTRRICEGHTGLKLAPGKLGLPEPLELRLLRTTIHTERFVRRSRMCHADRQALRHRHPNNVRQVVLALRVVVRQARKPGLEHCGGHSHNARVDFFDCFLRSIRVLVLDNSAYVSVGIAHDSPITCRICQDLSQDRHALSTRCEQCS